LDTEKLKTMTLNDLHRLAKEHEVKGQSTMRKQELVDSLTRLFSENGEQFSASGMLEIMSDGFGFLRRKKYFFSDDDIYISASQIRRFNMRTGDVITGRIRPPKDNERYYALLQVEEVNGEDPEKLAGRPVFTLLLFLSTRMNKLKWKLNRIFCPPEL
jgi:transcription termination factor Rho